MKLGQTTLMMLCRARNRRGVRRLLCGMVLLVSGVLAPACKRSTGGPVQGSTLQNVSFDISRDLFAELNPAARPALAAKVGRSIAITQSHAGASKQARSVIDGVDADVVTLNTVNDIDLIARRGQLLSTNWRSLKPFNSAPYTSVVVLVVRKGNPKNIRDWSDLTAPGVQLALPNPKTSGTGRMIYLSMWTSALRRFGGDEAQAERALAEFYARTPVLDTGSRGATITFAQRRMGDVLVTLEVEHHFMAREYPEAGFEVVYPGLSVEVEMPVAVVERVARKHGLLDAANAYLDFLYTPEAQEIIARNHFRPRNPQVQQRFTTNFPAIALVDVDRDLGGWDTIMVRHFGEGGIFDRAYDRKR